jgi:hypothetical protein
MTTTRTAMTRLTTLFHSYDARGNDLALDEATKGLLLDLLGLPEMQNVLGEPSLQQYETRDSAPFFCSLCGMGEMTIMDNKEGDKYFCRCSFWSDPHNAYIDRSGGNWLGWKNKEAAQEYADSQPTISVQELREALTAYFMGTVGGDNGDSK